MRDSQWRRLLLAVGLLLVLPTGFAAGQNNPAIHATPADRHEEPFAFWYGQPNIAELIRSFRMLSPTVQPSKPSFVPLENAHEQLVEGILSRWKLGSAENQSSRLKVVSWRYDSVWGPRNSFKTYSSGILAYQAPDKWFFRFQSSKDYQESAGGEESKYVAMPSDDLKHWVCDGKRLFEFDGSRKKLIECELPPDMQGRLLPFGPLPFLFGVNVDRLRERFWMRVITPADAQNEEWLELWPRHSVDARSFKRIDVIVDGKDGLPKALQVYDVGYEERKNPSRTVFVFSGGVAKVTQGKTPVHIVCEFPIAIATPKGWERIVERYPHEEAPESDLKDKAK